jgi:periplasmic divalent cation tolerance protein
MPPIGEMATDVRTVLLTAPDADVAERVGRALVEERLAACANIVPGVVSVFRWDGRVQREAEVLVIVKTTDERVEDLRARVVELHPYQVPEILVLPVLAGHAPYLEWVRGEVAARG